MRKVLSTTKVVLTIFALCMMFASLSNTIYANEIKDSVSYFASDSDFLIPSYDKKSKKELEEIKKQLTLTKEQEEKIYELLERKNRFLEFPNHSKDRKLLVIGNINREMEQILSKEQMNRLTSNKKMLSDLYLDTDSIKAEINHN